MHSCSEFSDTPTTPAMMFQPVFFYLSNSNKVSFVNTPSKHPQSLVNSSLCRKTEKLGWKREDEHDIYLSGGPATSCIDQKMEQVELTRISLKIEIKHNCRAHPFVVVV